MSTIDLVTTLDTLVCCNCGITFAVPGWWEQARRKDHREFYCPNGHNQWFSAKSEAEQLRDQLAAKDREIAAAKSRVETERAWRLNAEKSTDAVTRKLRATKAVITRTKKKIVEGRCPCCSHKFKDLAVHMQTQHPNYDPEKAATALEAKQS